MIWLRANVMTAVVILLVALLGLQTWKLHTKQLAYQTLVAQVEQDKQARTAAALKAVNDNTVKQETHATGSQENANELLEELTRQRDDAIRVATRNERLRIDQERRAATYRAMSEAGAASASALADRATALDRQLTEGVAVVAELRAVVERRDAEVKALMQQISVDRALFTQPSRPDGDITKGQP